MCACSNVFFFGRAVWIYMVNILLLSWCELMLLSLNLGIFTCSIYSEDCLFEDPTIQFRGKMLSFAYIRLVGKCGDIYFHSTTSVLSLNWHHAVKILNCCLNSQNHQRLFIFSMLCSLSLIFWLYEMQNVDLI